MSGGFKITQPRTNYVQLVSNSSDAGGIGGFPVCVSTPTINDVLTWDGTEWCGAPGSGGSSDCFDVMDYGAVHDGVTDDTVAIQDAIDACMAAGGGTVCFPNGIYAIKGALQSTSTYNSQLTVPQNAVSGSAPPVAIGFVGTGPAGQWNHGTSGAWDPGLSGAILLSDWAGTITNHPAVIAASKWDAIYPAATFNWIEATFQNIEIRTPANPKLSAIEFGGTASTSCINVTLSTNTDSASMVLPTNANAVGIRGPWINNANPPYLFQNLFVDGYYTGIYAQEVLHGVDVSVHHCTVGIEMAGPQFHATTFERLLFVAVATGIKITGGTFYLHIADLQIEHKSSGTFARVFDVDDASNFGKGFVIYHTVQAGVGVDNDLSVNGGTGVTWTSLDDGVFSGAPANVNYLVGTASAALSAEIVVGTTPGGELGNTWASPTVDTTHSGSAHADFIAKAFLNAKGDLISASANDTPALLTVGTDGLALLADSTQTSGLRWGVPTAAPSDTPVHVHVNNLTFSGDGATTDFELPASPVDAYSVMAYVAGVRTAITVSGSILTNMNFAVAPVSGTDNIIVDIAAAVA